MKRMICLMMVLLLMLGLAACGGEEAPKATETQPATDPAPVVQETTPVDDGKVTYTVHVEDENGTALSGVMVQICKDACLPGMTDAEGNAAFTVVEDDYKVSFLTLPAGYTYTTEETEFYFEDGATEITLVLKAQ